ncbi:DUF502 domain-containing protein [bacterium]|nr:DUF502 domain-containing protein [bacterium]
MNVKTGGVGTNSNPDQTPNELVRHFRDRLFEGLLVLLPVAITLWVIWWIYSTIEKKIIDPLAVLVIWKIRAVKSAPELPFWFENYIAPIIAIFLALGIIYFCGAMAHSRLRRKFDGLMLRVPLVSQIYDAVRSVLQVLDRPNDKKQPKRMVLVPFPHPGMRLPAIVTSSCKDSQTNQTLLCVYVPTTPVPTSGFFLMIPEDEVTDLNWDVQETLQTIISGGLTAPPFVSYYSTKDLAKSGTVLVKSPPSSDPVVGEDRT